MVIDVDGCELFGSAYELANEIALRAKGARMRAGLETDGQLAVAANPDAAIHAATREVESRLRLSQERGNNFASARVSRRHLIYSLVNIEKKIADEIFRNIQTLGH